MPTPPVPPKRPHVVSIHGDQVIDNYFWMRERDNPEVIAHLEAENRYTEEMTAHTAGLRERLYSEMRSRLREEDESVPDRYGPFVYFTRTQAGRQYPMVCRRPIRNAQEEILLDINTLAEGHAFTRIGVFRPTHDGRLLACRSM